MTDNKKPNEISDHEFQQMFLASSATIKTNEKIKQEILRLGEPEMNTKATNNITKIEHKNSKSGTRKL